MDEAQLYTLRIWRHATRWRAAVRAVGEEGALLFTEPAQLAAWLQAGGPWVVPQPAGPHEPHEPHERAATGSASERV